MMSKKDKKRKEPELNSVVLADGNAWQRLPNGWFMAGTDGSWNYSWKQLLKESSKISIVYIPEDYDSLTRQYFTIDEFSEAIMEYEPSKEKELRAAGYMTPGEFVDKLVPGLKEYLKHNWGYKPDEVYHPEDLFSNAEIYLEVARHVVGDFGVQPSKEKEEEVDGFDDWR
jgi:hypothetical protein